MEARNKGLILCGSGNIRFTKSTMKQIDINNIKKSYEKKNGSEDHIEKQNDHTEKDFYDLLKKIRKIIVALIEEDFKGNDKTTLTFSNHNMTINGRKAEELFLMQMTTSMVKVTYEYKQNKSSFRILFGSRQVISEENTKVVSVSILESYIDKIIELMNLYVDKKAELYKKEKSDHDY